MITKSNLATTADIISDPVESSLLELISHLIVEIIKENASEKSNESTQTKTNSIVDEVFDSPSGAVGESNTLLH